MFLDTLYLLLSFGSTRKAVATVKLDVLSVVLFIGDWYLRGRGKIDIKIYKT